MENTDKVASEDVATEKKDIVIRSKVTGKLYNDSNVHHVWDVMKVYKFISNGAQIIDVFPGHNSEGAERLCFCFSDEDYKLMQPLWMKHKL